ncbi:hypothetical protein GSI_05468 [Ganoderma sinense ZZ0214-1]|uniref:Uncharacterized protein n=1 Tax=Ganoderma sinense ZZ0214-1 TaxID=1077348 RepID=A0A2G8SEQ0_9APHY|nr:hypothetical protein GSI_05468 [Ganoderma sinense ZZ0214-1]
MLLPLARLRPSQASLSLPLAIAGILLSQLLRLPPVLWRFLQTLVFDSERVSLASLGNVVLKLRSTSLGQRAPDGTEIEDKVHHEDTEMNSKGMLLKVARPKHGTSRRVPLPHALAPRQAI